MIIHFILEMKEQLETSWESELRKLPHKKTSSRSFQLTKLVVLINKKALKAADMEDCNAVSTPASTIPLSKDADGDPFTAFWDYVMGMLMYLAGNIRPDIAFAVHQCARFTHYPKVSHGVAVKRILRYLKGTTKEQGKIFKPSSQEFQLDCYVDADFGGPVWGVEDAQEPISVKSRTGGYLIMFMNCPLLWVSKLQTQIALSTMEAEYIALSHSMREVIALPRSCKLPYLINLSRHPSFVLMLRPSSMHPFLHLKFMKIIKLVSSSLLRPICLHVVPPKHIVLPYHFFRSSKVKELEIEIVPIGTNNQLAPDQFTTKGLVPAKFVAAMKALMKW